MRFFVDKEKQNIVNIEKWKKVRVHKNLFSFFALLNHNAAERASGLQRSFYCMKSDLKVKNRTELMHLRKSLNLNDGEEFVQWNSHTQLQLRML